MNADGEETRMFYVFHSGTISNQDEDITLIDGKAFAEMVFEAGLVSWLTLRVA